MESFRGSPAPAWLRSRFATASMMPTRRTVTGSLPRNFGSLCPAAPIFIATSDDARADWKSHDFRRGARGSGEPPAMTPGPTAVPSRPSTPSALEITGLVKNYSGLRPLRIADLSVAHGERVAI